MRYRCIHRRRNQFSIRMMCQLLKVSRSGYYDWCTRSESATSRRNRELTLLIRQLHLESGGVYGARKIRRDLMEIGEHCGRHRVARLMRQSGLKGCPKRRFRRYANSPPNHSVAVNIRFFWNKSNFTNRLFPLQLNPKPIVTRRSLKKFLTNIFQRILP